MRPATQTRTVTNAPSELAAVKPKLTARLRELREARSVRAVPVEVLLEWIEANPAASFREFLRIQDHLQRQIQRLTDLLAGEAAVAVADRVELLEAAGVELRPARTLETRWKWSGWRVVEGGPVAYRWRVPNPGPRLEAELRDLLALHASELVTMLQRRAIEDRASAASPEATRPYLAETDEQRRARFARTAAGLCDRCHELAW